MRGVSGDGSIAIGWGGVGNGDVEPFVWDATRGFRNLTSVLRDGTGRQSENKNKSR